LVAMTVDVAVFVLVTAVRVGVLVALGVKVG
jgi:hypothetical protein